MQEQLLPEERLDLLRASDRDRPWYSLDDKRVCAICERIFAGREIEIRSRGRSHSLHCPSVDCPSDFRHWLIWQPAPDGASPPVDEKDGEYSFL
jgi:hypothetical protein